MRINRYKLICWSISIIILVLFGGAFYLRYRVSTIKERYNRMCSIEEEQLKDEEAFSFLDIIEIAGKDESINLESFNVNNTDGEVIFNCEGSLSKLKTFLEEIKEKQFILDIGHINYFEDKGIVKMRINIQD